ncbi:MAG: hypothetical protein IPK82_16065 [Polyangiaceae bacterium]|nr:hypothetical protein [Polyangiaceae bacterium]
MLRTTLALLALIPTLVMGTSTCASPVESEDFDDVAEEAAEIAAVPKAMIGTFRTGRPEVGQPTVVTFMTDGTYHRAGVVACFAAPCPPVEENGNYTVWYRDRGSYVSFYPDTDRSLENYQFYITGNVLRMNKVGTPNWVSLLRTESGAWCGETPDCWLQNLPTGPCASNWYCAQNMCKYSCLPPDPEE